MSQPAPPSANKARTLGFAVAGLMLLADQALKWAMIAPLHLRQTHSLRLAVGDLAPTSADINLLPFFGFSWTENYGVSLGLFTAGSDMQRWMLVAATCAIALGVFIWLLRERWLGDTLPLGLVLGGALGNIIDRAGRGFVVDFLDLHFGAFRPFLVFNLADVAITFGVLIILARSFLSREKLPANPVEPAPSAPEK